MSSDGLGPGGTTSIAAFDQMLATKKASALGKHSLLLMEAQLDKDGIALNAIRHVAMGHYVAPAITAARLAALGAPKTAALLQEHLPTSKASRSGDFGEILATEIAERKLGYQVPVRRLRWKDGREMAMRGDDLIGVVRLTPATLQILKGESKSRAELDTTTVNAASEALGRNRGRPSRHSVLFVADRLREAGDEILARDLEEAVLQSFRGNVVDHFLFSVCGNDPDSLLSKHFAACKTRKRARHVVGLRVNEHAAVVKSVFDGI